jgi:protein SCO1/2
LGNTVPLDLQFTDHAGSPVRLGDFFHKRPVVLHLVYYQCPMLCRLSSDGLFRVVPSLPLEMGDDYSIVTVSFDAREGSDLSARARRAAAERCGNEAVERGWFFLTGEQNAIDALCRSVGFRYKFDEKTNQFAHAAGVFVLNADGTVSRFLSGVDFPPRDLRLSIVEASAGKVGAAADQVLLMCYMYDPTTGRYGFAVMTAIRTGGVLTVLALATSITVMLRRERRRSRARQVPAVNPAPPD